MLQAHLHADASRHLITCRPLAAGCRILCAMLCESCTNICTSNTHVLNGNIITLSRTYSSTIQNAEFDFRLQTSLFRMQNEAVSCFGKNGSSLCILCIHLRPFYALSRSFSKILEASKMRIRLRRCIHSSPPLRIQTSTAILQSAPSTADFESTEASLQSSTATSEFRLGRRVEFEVRDFTSECRMQNAARASK